MTSDLLKCQTVVQDHKLNHSFMSAHYLNTRLILQVLNRK